MKPGQHPTVLFVDDEERILRTLTILFRSSCRVLATSDPAQALAWVQEQHIHVVVSDQRMPAMNGSELLARVRELSPDTVRVLLTGYAEVDAAISALNDGEIYRYLAKPWTADGIQRTVREAISVAQTMSGTLATAAHAPEDPASPAEVLVIDSDPETQAVVQAAATGTPVVAARTMTEAVELLGRRKIGIIVTEVVVNGDDMTHLLRALKQQQPEILAIVLTGLRDTPRLVRLINQAQVFRFLPKPARPGMLAMAIAAAVSRRMEQDRLRRVVPSLRVEEASSEVERTLSNRIGSYLARLRARNAVTPA